MSARLRARTSASLSARLGARMARTAAVALVAVMLLPALFPAGAPAAAQGVPPPSEDNGLPQPGDVGRFIPGTTAFAQRAVAENANGSLLRIFEETFDERCSGLPTGWTEEARAGRSTAWHLDCLNMQDLAAGRETAIVQSSPGSASIRVPEGGYPARMDTRLISPVVDLRWVSGRAAETDAVMHEAICAGPASLDPAISEACANATASFESTMPFSADSLHSFARDLRNLFSGFSTAATPLLRPLAAGAYIVPDDASDLPLTPEALGFGMVNLTFYHAWDWKAKSNAPADGGLVEIRYQKDDGSWSSWLNLEGDLVLETEVGWADAVQESGCGPWLTLSKTSGLNDPSSVVNRNVQPAVCRGFDYWQSPCFALDASGSTCVPFLGEVETPVASTDTSEPGISFSALYTRFAEHKDTRGPNGRVDPDGSSAPTTTPNPEGYVGKSEGMRMSKYTLNRFIGKQIQVAFRAVSVSEAAPSERGWFVDDVAITALVPSRDVGVLDILAPKPGDTVNAANSAIAPKAIIKNFGRTSAERVMVSFEIVEIDGDRTWGPFLAPAPLTLAPLEARVVSPARFWSASEPGEFEVRVRTWIDSAVTPGGPAGQPQTDLVGANDVATSTFFAEDVRTMSVRVLVDPTSSVTDLDSTKTGKVRLENLGNLNLTGTVHFWYDTTDTSSVPVRRENALQEVRPPAVVSIPHGRNTSAYGADVNWLEIPWTWTQRVSPTDPSSVPAGVYAIVATFTPDSIHAAMGIRTDAELVFVRATPPPAVAERFEAPSRLANPTPYLVQDAYAAVESVGWTPNALAWVPTAYSRTAGGSYDVVRPSAAEGTAMWVGIGEDCLEPAKDEPCFGSGASNLVDWYVLRKEVTATAAANAVRVDFATQAFFSFADGDAVNRTRGHVRIFPREMDAAVDAARAAGDSVGLPGQAPGQVLSFASSAHACGRVENTTYSIGGTPFNVLALVIETPHLWKRCSLSAGVGWIGSPNVAVEWVLETNRTRLASYPNRSAGDPVGSDAWCQGDELVVPAITCPLVAPEMWGRWFLDDTRVSTLSGSTVVAQLPAAGAAADAANSRSFFTGCTFFSAFNNDFECRGWRVQGSHTAGTAFPSNWYVEKSGDVDGSASFLRYGYLRKGAVPTDGDPMGRDYVHPDDNPNIGRSVTVSALRGPAFELTGFSDPALTFSTKFLTLPCVEDDGVTPRIFYDFDRREPQVLDGFSVWIIGTRDGAEVARSLLVPDGGYNARLWAKAGTGTPASTGQCGTSEFHGHPFAAEYHSTAGNNVWAGPSGLGADGSPEWIRKTFSLASYAQPQYAGVQWSVELRAVTQWSLDSREGYWKVDDLRVEDRIAANDVGISSIAISDPGLSNIPGQFSIGPGQQQVISTVVTNTGLFDQTGVGVEYVIRDAKGQVNKSWNQSFPRDEVLPGFLGKNPQRNETMAFTQTWTPTVDGLYTITVRTRLDSNYTADPFPDSNPSNDERTITIIVIRLPSLGLPLASALPDESLVTPVVGGAGEPRTLRVTVQNTGTIPANYDGDLLGELYLNVTVRDESNVTLAGFNQSIASLGVGKSTTIEFRDAWVPTRSGLYTVDFRLVVRAAPDGVSRDATDSDNLRRVKVIVFNRIVPPTGEAWSEKFAGSGAWRQDENRTGLDGWTFGGPYPNGADGVLALKDLVNLRSIRNLFLVIDQRYAFEEGYDGGLVEVSEDGVTWYPVPPADGYPLAMSTASPLVEDPFSPISAFTGATNGFVAIDLDLGAVEPLRAEVDLLTADFSTTNPFAEIGTACGAWRGEVPPAAECLEVKPTSGDGMWFSDKYARLCRREWRARAYTTTGTAFNSYTYPGFGTVQLTVEDGNASFAGGRTFSFPAVDATDPVQRARMNTPWANRTFSFGDQVCSAPWQTVLLEETWIVPAGTFAGQTRLWRLELVAPEAGEQVWTGDATVGPLLATMKTLKADFTVPSDARDVFVSYRDWRAIGATVQAREVAGVKQYVTLPESNAVEVVICCDDFGGAIKALVAADRTAAADNYRDWTVNSFKLTDVMEKIRGRTVTIEFRHYVATGFPQAAAGGSAITWAEPGDTDWQSPHIGWAIDDVLVVESETPTSPLLKLDADAGPQIGNAVPGYRTTCHESKWDSPPRLGAFDCPYLLSPTPGIDVETGPQSWTTRSSVWGRNVWKVENGRLVAVPSLISTANHDKATGYASISKVTGEDARLILPLDLKSAVANATLEFDTQWKFATFGNIEPTGTVPYSSSAGQLEVSVDGGATWVAIHPTSPAGEEREFLCRGPAFSTHSTLLGTQKDPQTNSDFGICGTALGLDSPDAVRGDLIHMTYDLTPFRGRDVLLGFHVQFATNREAAGTRVTGTLPAGHDRWIVDNLRVSASILDTRDVLLRLRAGADTSVVGDGWDVRDLGLLGVKHTANVAVVPHPPGELGLVGKGEANFTVEVVNKGQAISEGTMVVAWVNATDASGALVPARSVTFGPALLAQWVACAPVDQAAIDGAGRLRPESSARLCALTDAAGAVAELKFFADPAYTFTITARIADANDAKDSVKADNRGVAVIPRETIVEGSRLLVESARASPNTYRGTGEVVLSATFLNYGIARARLADGSPALVLTAPDGTSASYAPDTLPTTLFDPLQRATFTWTLPAARLDSAVHGAGVWTGLVTIATDKGSLEERSVGIHVGSGVLADLGHIERVKPMRLDDSLSPNAWAESHRWCAAPNAPWDVRGPGSGASTGWFNTSAFYSFGLPRQAAPPTALSDDNGGSTPNPCVGGIFNMIRSPRIPVRGVVGPDGLEHLFLTFQSRHSFPPSSYGAVELTLYGPDGLVVPFSGTASTSAGGHGPSTGDRALAVLRLTGDTASHSSGVFEPQSVDILQAIRTWNGFATTDPTANNAIRLANVAAIQFAFVQYGASERSWQVDDIVLSPLGVAFDPEQSYPAVDDTDKEYRFVLRNAGSYTDDFRVSVRAPPGQARITPAGWHVVLLDEQDRIVWHDGTTLANPPPGCNPLPVGPSGTVEVASSIRLDPGERHIVRAKVCIPISETLAGRSASTTFILEASGLGNPYGAVRTSLTLAYSYAERPNLVLPANGVSVDNPDLPVDQPRAVTVTVQNAGTVYARDVLVRVIDTMDPSFGYEPVELVGLNGQPVPLIANLSSRGIATPSFLWTPRAVGEHNLTVILDPLDTIRESREGDNTLRLKLPIGKAEFPDLVVSLSVATEQPARGQATTVEMRVTNIGGRAASGVELKFGAGVTDFLRHTGASPNDFVDRIEPGATFVMRHTWTPAFSGNIILYATAFPRNAPLEPASDGRHDDNSAYLPVLVRATQIDVALQGPTVTAAPGGTVTLPFSVAAAETEDTLGLLIQAPPGVTPAIRRSGAIVSGVALAPHENVSFELELTLPARIAAGEYAVNVTARSIFPSAAADTARLTLVVSAVRAFAIEAVPVTIAPGRISVPIAVLNDGNAPDLVTITAPSLPAGWVSEGGNATVGPYARGLGSLVLNLPGSTPAGVYEVFVRGDDGTTSADATLLLEVIEAESLAATVLGPVAGIRPGDALDLSVRVENVGNVRGEAALKALPPRGWTATLGRGLVALGVGESTTIPLSLLVPRNATSGVRNLTIESLGLRSNGSTVAHLTVTQSDLKVADLTFSPRVNVAPGTLVTFNASIVNEGLAARNVTVAFYADDFLIGVERLAVVDRAGTNVVFRWIAQPGEHVLLLLVDPGNVLEESDEANNARLEVLKVSGETGVLAAARQAVPDVSLWATLGLVAAAAFAVARRRGGR